MLIAAAEILEQSNLPAPLSERQEAGAVVASEGQGDYSIDGGVVSQGRVNTVSLRLRMLADGSIVTVSGKPLAATMHSHPGVGRVTIDGKRLMLWGGAASAADREQARTTGKPVYILNSHLSMLRVDAATGRATTILNGKDYRAYIERATMERSAALEETP